MPYGESTLQTALYNQQAFLSYMVGEGVLLPCISIVVHTSSLLMELIVEFSASEFGETMSGKYGAFGHCSTVSAGMEVGAGAIFAQAWCPTKQSLTWRCTRTNQPKTRRSMLPPTTPPIRAAPGVCTTEGAGVWEFLTTKGTSVANAILNVLTPIVGSSFTPREGGNPWIARPSSIRSWVRRWAGEENEVALSSGGSDISVSISMELSCSRLPLVSRTAITCTHNWLQSAAAATAAMNLVDKDQNSAPVMGMITVKRKEVADSSAGNEVFDTEDAIGSAVNLNEFRDLFAESETTAEVVSPISPGKSIEDCRGSKN
jgi:hypothetical protein